MQKTILHMQRKLRQEAVRVPREAHHTSPVPPSIHYTA
ncbi:hypothetical protein CDEF62S_05977 [Castellaniella defragrans]